MRKKNLIKAIASGYLAKAVSIALLLLTPIIFSSSLDNERLGALAYILSLQEIVLLVDIGIGSYFLNRIAQESKNQHLVEKSISCGVQLTLILSSIPLLLGIFFLIFDEQIKLSENTKINNEIQVAISFLIILYAIMIPLTFIQKIQFSINESHIGNIYKSAGALISLFLILWLSKFKSIELKEIIITFLSGTIILLAVNAFKFIKKIISNKKILISFDFPLMRIATKEAFPFFLMQVIFIVTYSLDTTLIINVLGIGRVSDYYWIERIFSINTIIISIITVPLWAYYAQIIGEKKIKAYQHFIKDSKKIIILSLLVSFAIMITIIFLSQTTKIIPYSVDIPFITLLSFWKVIEAFGMIMTAYAYALNILKELVYMGLLTAASSILIKIIFLESNGLAIIPLANIFSYSLFCLIPLYFIIQNDAKNTKAD